MLGNIYFRMLGPFVLAIFVSNIFAWWMGVSVLAKALERRVSEQLDYAAQLTVSANFPLTDDVLRRMSSLQQAGIFLLSSQGTVLERPGDGVEPRVKHGMESAFGKWLANGQGSDTVRLRLRDTEYLVLFRSLPAVQLHRGNYIVLWSDLSHIKQATIRGSLWLGLGVLVGILVLALIGHWIARSITQPLSELSALAISLAQGDRSARAHLQRNDEIGSLSDSLNTMAAELESYEQQVAEASRLSATAELAARVAHEIRNPLTAIIMQLEMLQDSIDQLHRQRVTNLLNEARRLELITSTALQLSRPDQINREAANLNNMVREVVQLMTAQFRHRHIEVEMELEPNLRDGQFDAFRIKQILFNLLSNAIDELFEGGSIRVRTRSTTDGQILLTLEDSGKGIPRELLGSLFDGAATTKPTGFGLGLQITRQLVELHDGRIEVSDSDLGGAKFELFF